MGRYDNFFNTNDLAGLIGVVEAYRLGRYDNDSLKIVDESPLVVEAYRLGRYDNSERLHLQLLQRRCRSLSFG